MHTEQRNTSADRLLVNPSGARSSANLPKSAREKNDALSITNAAEIPIVSSKYSSKLHLDLTGVVKNGMTLKPMMSTIDEYPQMPQSHRDAPKSSERESESGIFSNTQIIQPTKIGYQNIPA